MTQLDRIEKMLAEMLQRLPESAAPGEITLTEMQELQLMRDFKVDPIEYARARKNDREGARRRLLQGWN